MARSLMPRRPPVLPRTSGPLMGDIVILGERTGEPERPKFGHLRADKVAVSVAHEIVRDLAGLEPGSMLPSEATMLGTYAVSRGSLREALRILEVQGLIQIRPGPGGGPVFIGPESASLGRTETLFFHLLGAKYLDLLKAQAVLEPTIARVAAANPDRRSLDLLESFVDLDLADPEDPVLYKTYTTGFHNTMIGVCGNPILAMITRSLRDITTSRIGPEVYSTETERQDIVEVHGRIASAILAGKEAMAEALMADHMQVYCNRLIERKSEILGETVDWH